ncbi:MAG: riboflavin kinase [Glaciihabitans sp.]|nr:riboflavin kinase [Glaciihabitans sp.]
MNNQTIVSENPTFSAPSVVPTSVAKPAPEVWQPGTPRLEITGVVEHGNAWGRLLGFPTANLPLDNHDVDGVWAGTVRFVEGANEETGNPGREVEYVAAISIGTRQTYYSDGVRLLEAHLLDFAGDLYGIPITVGLHELVRGQVKFAGSDELVAQLIVDVQDVRHWAASNLAGAAQLG